MKLPGWQPGAATAAVTRLQPKPQPPFLDCTSLPLPVSPSSFPPDAQLLPGRAPGAPPPTLMLPGSTSLAPSPDFYSISLLSVPGATSAPPLSRPDSLSAGAAWRCRCCCHGRGRCPPLAAGPRLLPFCLCSSAAAWAGAGIWEAWARAAAWPVGAGAAAARAPLCCGSWRRPGCRRQRCCCRLRRHRGLAAGLLSSASSPLPPPWSPRPPLPPPSPAAWVCLAGCAVCWTSSLAGHLVCSVGHGEAGAWDVAGRGLSPKPYTTPYTRNPTP